MSDPFCKVDVALNLIWENRFCACAPVPGAGMTCHHNLVMASRVKSRPDQIPSPHSCCEQNSDISESHSRKEASCSLTISYKSMYLEEGCRNTT